LYLYITERICIKTQYWHYQWFNIKIDLYFKTKLKQAINRYDKSDLDTTSLVDDIKQATSRYDEYVLRSMARSKYRTRKAKGCQEGAVYDLAAVMYGEMEIIQHLTELGVTIEEIHDFRFGEGFVNVEKLYRKILQSKNFF